MSKICDSGSDQSIQELTVNLPEGGGLSRRAFARDLALAAATAVVVPNAVMAQAEKTAAPAKPPVSSEVELSAEAKAEAETNYAAVLRKYGNRFSNEQKADLRRLLLQQQKSIEMLRGYRLENGDGPATVLHLVTGEER